MAFCSNCGAKLEENAGFCANCGTAVKAPAQPANVNVAQPQYQQPQAQYQQPQAQAQTDCAKMFSDFWNKIVGWVKKQLDTDDHSAMLDPRDVADNKVFGIFAYPGLFCLIPMFAAPKNSKFSRYHANQGLLLLICNAIYAIICCLLNLIKVPVYRFGFRVGSTTPVIIPIILAILSLPIIALVVLGIINVVNGKCKDLPFIGKIKLLKVK